MWYRTEFNLNVLYIHLRTRKMPFCGRAAESALKMHFHRLLRENWGEFQNGMYVEW